jgi:hypothetical protein
MSVCGLVDPFLPPLRLMPSSVIAFVFIIIIDVIGIAIIATTVIASIKLLVDIQHAADRRDEDTAPSQRRQSSSNTFPKRKVPDMLYPILSLLLAPLPPPPRPPHADDDMWLRRGEGGGAGLRQRRRRRRQP